MHHVAALALLLVATPAVAQPHAADPVPPSVAEQRALGAAKAKRDGEAYDRRAAERHRAWEGRVRTTGEIPAKRVD